MRFNSIEKASRRTIYSWNRELFEVDPEVITCELRQNRINTVYQGLYPSDFSKKELPRIIEEYRSRQVEIVYLVGEPSWHDAETVIYWALEPLVRYNRGVGAISKINAVCFDIEFFNSESEISFDEYSAMIKGIYEFCHENNLEVIVCLPYWIPEYYDGPSFEKLLEYVDLFSCSVFLVGYEEELIQTIAQLCKVKGKPFESILDIQPENDKYNVKTANTYFHKGLQAVIRVFDTLEQKYGSGTSIHNLSEYRRLLDKI